jgi:PKD repeat protein
LVAFPTEGTSPLNVRFNDTSDYPVLQLPVTWYWEFDDGTSSVLQNPVHTFTRGRLYNVSFTVTNPRGSRQVSQSINVYVPVTRFASNVTLGYSPLTVGFSDTSVNAAALPTDYHWDFDDGTASNLQEPVHTFTDGKCYDVSFTVSSQAGTDSFTGTIPVYKPDFSAIPGYGGNPLAVLFEDTGYGCIQAEPTAWYWDFGDGFSSDKRNTVHQYVAPGTYNVGLRVTGPAGETWVYKTAVVMVT